MKEAIRFTGLALFIVAIIVVTAIWPIYGLSLIHI